MVGQSHSPVVQMSPWTCNYGLMGQEQQPVGLDDASLERRSQEGPRVCSSPSFQDDPFEINLLSEIILLCETIQ